MAANMEAINGIIMDLCQAQPVIVGGRKDSRVILVVAQKQINQKARKQNEL